MKIRSTHVKSNFVNHPFLPPTAERLQSIVFLNSKITKKGIPPNNECIPLETTGINYLATPIPAKRFWNELASMAKIPSLPIVLMGLQKLLSKKERTPW